MAEPWQRVNVGGSEPWQRRVILQALDPIQVEPWQRVEVSVTIEPWQRVTTNINSPPAEWWQVRKFLT